MSSGTQSDSSGKMSQCVRGDNLHIFLLALRQATHNLLTILGETGVGCHTGWLSHCQYLIHWMSVPCGDLHVTCEKQTEPHNVQTLAADRIFRLLQIHITFRVTFVIFVVIVAYDVAIVLFQICMNSPVHRIKQNISYQSDSVQQSVTQMA